MKTGTHGLGKGLGALIRETSITAQPEDVRTLLLKDITPNPNQPRRTFSEQALQELAVSIREQGLLQPILVRPLPGEGGLQKYEIVAGERRWRASKQAGLVEVPVIVRSFTDKECLAAALVENIQRENLNPMEEAEALNSLKNDFALSQEELAANLGKSRSAIANSLRLLSLPECIRADVAGGKLSSGHARALLSVTEAATQAALHALILSNELTVREAEGLAALWKETGSLDVPAAGAPAAPVGTQPAPTRNGAAKSPVRPQSAVLLAAQTRLGQALAFTVKISGKEEKGKITIAYNSKEELEAVLAAFEQHHNQGAPHTGTPE